MERTSYMCRAAAVVLAIGACAVLAPAAGAQTPPFVSDTYQGAAIPEPNVNFTRGDTGSLTSAGEPLAPPDPQKCASGSQLDHTAWFRVIGTGGRIRLTTAQSNFDTLIAVYPANQTPAPNTAILCDDDSRARLAESAFNSVAGATYYTQWGGCVTHSMCGASSGFLSYTVLTNDRREDAVDAINRTRTNMGATKEATGEQTTCEGAAYDRTVWFRWVAPAEGSVTFSVARFDTVSALYRGNSPAYFTCNDTAEGDALRSQVGAGVQKGEVLYLQVGGKVSGSSIAEGNFSLAVDFAEDADLDNDGFPRGPDCADGDPNVKPGARDIPHNGIDEDCVNGDNLDGDGDGQARRPPGADCNDGDPRIFFGAREIAGNFTDENCDGRTPATSLNPMPTVSFGSVAQLRGRLFGRMTVTGVARGYRIVARCRGSSRCPKGKFDRTAKSRKPVRTRKFAGSLPPGARVDITVTRPGENRYGHFVRYAVKAPRALVKRLCRIEPRTGRRSKCQRG